jgi:hypothetical protein
MDDRSKKGIILATLGSFAVIQLSAPNWCGPREICSIEPPDMWHTEQQERVPTQTVPSWVDTSSGTGSTHYPIYAKVRTII